TSCSDRSTSGRSTYPQADPRQASNATSTTRTASTDPTTPSTSSSAPRPDEAPTDPTLASGGESPHDAYIECVVPCQSNAITDAADSFAEEVHAGGVDAVEWAA